MLSLDEQVQVPFGHWRRTLMTKDFTRHAGISGTIGREELIRFRR